MKKEEIKEKGIQGVKKIIFGRTLFVIFAFLIQFALLAVTYIWLRDYSYVFYLLFVILSVSVVLHLLTVMKALILNWCGCCRWLFSLFLERFSIYMWQPSWEQK